MFSSFSNANYLNPPERISKINSRKGVGSFDPSPAQTKGKTHPTAESDEEMASVGSINEEPRI